MIEGLAKEEMSLDIEDFQEKRDREEYERLKKKFEGVI
jgi:hypothetical protein